MGAEVAIIPACGVEASVAVRIIGFGCSNPHLVGGSGSGPQQSDTVRVTADERYFGKAAALGHIIRLHDWPAWFAGR